MAEKVEIEIVAKDKTGGAVKSVTANFQKLREVGEKIHLSRERVRQIEAESLEALRQRFDPKAASRAARG